MGGQNGKGRENHQIKLSPLQLYSFISTAERAPGKGELRRLRSSLTTHQRGASHVKSTLADRAVCKTKDQFLRSATIIDASFGVPPTLTFLLV